LVGKGLLERECGMVPRYFVSTIGVDEDRIFKHMRWQG